ncbi:unnamed protein product [Cyprideis torosa]|uniref:carbonic anhydrase n=1 Tax=Cyprideis torosa TaxID=163714 RepID=A0A7R8WHH6_9CRUS|nr:unnamed protein product [Cyprideis torosa]CAG0893807.1 unnamed protein product [Cyprideis torosa]
MTDRQWSPEIRNGILRQRNDMGFETSWSRDYFLGVLGPIMGPSGLRHRNAARRSKSRTPFSYKYHGMNWPNEFLTFCNSRHQSPLDFPDPTDIPHATFESWKFEGYNKKLEGLSITNDGHSAKVPMTDVAAFISGAGLTSRYRLEQFHFHWGSDSSQGSEHRILGKQLGLLLIFPLELHLVHYRVSYASFATAAKSGYSDALAIFGVLFEIQPEDNPKIGPIIEAVSKITYEGDTGSVPEFRLEDLMPKSLSYYRYMGSLTTPRCWEEAIWSVFSETVGISEKQMEAFRKLLQGKEGEGGGSISNNYRYPQPLSGRMLLYVEDGKKREKKEAETKNESMSTTDVSMMDHAEREGKAIFNITISSSTESDDRQSSTKSSMPTTTGAPASKVSARSSSSQQFLHNWAMGSLSVIAFLFAEMALL